MSGVGAYQAYERCVDAHGNGHSSGQAIGTNIAKLSAVLDALQGHPDVAHLVIQIDSTYARDCSTTWRVGWPLRTGMRNSKRQPLKNANTVKAIQPIWAAQDTRVTVELAKVPGHDPGNQHCGCACS